MQNVKAVVENQRLYFNAGNTRDIAIRKAHLKKLQQAIKKHEAEICVALKKDLNKAPFEAYETEIGIVLEEIRYLLKHMDRALAPKAVHTPITHFLSSSHIHQEPYGVVLIMSPWNYPFQLTMAPLVGALACGNCVLLKPSNYSPATSKIIFELIGKLFDPGLVSVVQGGREANAALLEQAFDYIFFTGSVSVGKLVMGAAAQHLTPVTLELGGKSPCIVDKTADVQLAAKRITWGKFLNAGQTCVAPDYLLVHQDIKDDLLSHIKGYIATFYGDTPQQNPEYPKIINQKHFERLQALMRDGTVYTGGQANLDTLQIAPTILQDVTWDEPVMREEIFGPILPILTFANLDEVPSMINAHPKPLALYFFTGSKEDAGYITKHISYGGGCINDTIVHLATTYMPFGGVGQSGMGAYHGKASFTTFSHAKSILTKSNLLDIFLRYPPFKNHLKWLRKVLR